LNLTLKIGRTRIQYNVNCNPPSLLCGHLFIGGITDSLRYLNRGILNLLAGQKEKAQEDIAKALTLDANVYTLVSQYFTVRLDRNPHDIRRVAYL
jgi:hypothetical protein